MYYIVVRNVDWVKIDYNPDQLENEQRRAFFGKPSFFTPSLNSHVPDVCYKHLQSVQNIKILINNIWG